MSLEPINNPGQPQPEPLKVKPSDVLDFNLMVIDSVWGKDSISLDLQEKLKNVKATYKDAEGNLYVDKESLWGLLGFYTRDMRLSNLDTQQFRYTVYYTDLAGDFLKENFINPFLICLSRVATILELSQSRGGFLRNRQNTLTQEWINRGGGLEPPKKNILTGKDMKS
jgi:hypothetical protein